MAGGFESVKRKSDGLWIIRAMRIGSQPIRGGDGEVLTFSTKKEAEQIRKALQRQLTGVPRERSEIFASRVDRSRRSR